MEREREWDNARPHANCSAKCPGHRAAGSARYGHRYVTYAHKMSGIQKLVTWHWHPPVCTNCTICTFTSYVLPNSSFIHSIVEVISASALC
ncbi:Os07g0115450 [Oryza sativa Japonica Group]|uniref:Os07g0115450 protein n=1 Tax=Oryza sativa subsp. japonica TaxID=39947 RepID=C7J4I2_ORYSJ|nr:Os07g0115450 [Oryza sativa Japonica Group]|eukprot:NP_001175022.1 Os07g0115450 [Oryza sativa Japonica Group]